jgi:diadenylate cyclase
VTLLIVGTILAYALNLTMLNWLLRNSIPALIVVIPILFQPELRRALEQIGRAGGLLPHSPTLSASAHVVDVIAIAARRLSERRWGALIVLERDTGLGEYVETGVPIDGALSVELVLNVFFPNSPLHDGAVIVRGERLGAAGCVLPLADVHASPTHYGTRHRAAIGISEQTDAIVIVISEETGSVSLVMRGRIERNLTEEQLRRRIFNLIRPQAPRQRMPLLRRSIEGRWQVSREPEPTPPIDPEERVVAGAVPPPEPTLTRVEGPRAELGPVGREGRTR